jgi:hypothetical protein
MLRLFRVGVIPVPLGINLNKPIWIQAASSLYVVGV